MWISQDAAPYFEADNYKTWFYFSVTGVPQGEVVTFNFKNLNNQVRIDEKVMQLIVETILARSKACVSRYA